MQLLLCTAALVLNLASGLSSPQTENTSGVELPAVPDFDKTDAAIYGQDLAAFADTYDHGWVDEIDSGTMTLFDAGGDSVRRSFTRLLLENSKEGDKIITKFTSPADIKGVTALTHENSGSSDDNWLYLPSNKRVRRISGANNTASFQGTEFTYEDLATVDPQEYDWSFAGEVELERSGKKLPVFKVDAVPTYEDTGYSRIVVYINREQWRHERIEYYDKAGRLLKTRETSSWMHVHGRFWRPRKIEMTNHQTGKRTELELPKQYVNLSLYKSSKTGEPRANLTEDLFTTRSIQS